jgi:hypothetical protein
MRTTAALASVAVLASFLLAPGAAFAQEPEERPAPPVAPLPPPVEAAPPGVTVVMPPCRLAEHAGYEEPDARTAAQLVCSAIARAGASPAEHYRVSLGKLGSAVILSVAQEGGTVGSTVDSREMRLTSIEEVEVAAPRIADAIVHGVPLVETEKVDNLVGPETRQPKSKAGKVHFALGLLGMAPPLNVGVSPSPGMILDTHYETGNQRLELTGSFRFAAGSGDNTSPQANAVLFSIGTRYFTSDTDFSPYVGGGLSWGYYDLKLPASDSAQYVEAQSSGLGAYVDAGFEILRTHHAHLAIGARLDLPFFALHNTDYSSGYVDSAGNYVSGTTSSSNYYYLPVSLEMRLTF